MSHLLVLHDLGAAGGDEWNLAFAGWIGSVDAPDLPGHGRAAQPVGGHHEVGDALFAVADRLDGDPPVVLGVGANGHSARVIALGGRASGLVLVDGLGGPWLDVPARNVALRELRREVLLTPGTMEAHQPPGTDVRATMVLPVTDRAHVVDVCSRIAVPTLVVETPASSTPDADEVSAVFPDARLVRIGERTPAAVAEVVVAWWDERSPS